MKNQPKISIIVPIHNVELYIHRCINSILGQTFNDFELILVNDGSTDSSGVICEKYAKKDERIFVIHQKNKGQSAARNLGIDIARGKFLSFVDSDDQVESTFIETLYELSVKYNAHISECGYTSVYKDKKVVCEFGNHIEFGEGNFLVEKFLKADIFYGVVTKLFSASLFNKVRFPEGRIYEDTWMTLYFCLDPLRYVRTQTALYNYYQTNNSTLRSAMTFRKAREYIYLLENQLGLVNEKVLDNVLKKRLKIRILEKSVFWYLDMALSDQSRIRRIYSRLYLRRMNLSILGCFKLKNITWEYKISYLFCKARLHGLVRLFSALYKLA